MRYILLAFLMLFCSERKSETCVDRGIEIEYLIDIDKLIKDGYKCEEDFNNFNTEELKNCRLLFADANYKVLYNGYKTRLLFDKKENLKIAINSITPDFKTIKDRPFALYVLNENLMPVYAIAKLGSNVISVYKSEYVKNEIVLKRATEKEANNINIGDFKYTEILQLIKKMKSGFSYKKEKKTIDPYFYNVPYWTEGLN